MANTLGHIISGTPEKISGNKRELMYKCSMDAPISSPVTGTILATSTENNIVIEDNKGIKVLVRQIAGALARRIVCYAKIGDQVEQGQEFGFIKFGSRVDIFLPLGTDIKVKLGEVVKGGITILAELK